MRLNREEVGRIAASFAAIPDLYAVVVERDGSGVLRVCEIEAADGISRPTPTPVAPEPHDIADLIEFAPQPDGSLRVVPRRL